MTFFIAAASLMALLAAALIAWPLLAHRQDRVLGIAAAVIVCTMAGVLYPLWSSWDWKPLSTSGSVKGAASADISAMLQKLEQRLVIQPDDQAGWLMLGRSYLVLQRADAAVAAYEHAYTLVKNTEAALGLGEAISVAFGGEVTPRAAALFEEALSLSPENPQALLDSGFAAAASGDAALALARWQTLKGMHPAHDLEELLDARIAELPVPVVLKAAAATQSIPAPKSAESARAVINLKISPRLETLLKATAPVYLFARIPGVPGPPVAARRLANWSIGTRVVLSAADSVMPGRALTGGQRVSITARVSFSGQPTPASGDIYGEVLYQVGKDGPVDLVIDHITE